jgi:hypothetical protein
VLTVHGVFHSPFAQQELNKCATRKDVDELIGTSISNVMASVDSRGAAAADVEGLAQRTADKVSSLRSELVRLSRSIDAVRDDTRHSVTRTEVVQALQCKAERTEVEAALERKVSSMCKTPAS